MVFGFSQGQDLFDFTWLRPITFSIPVELPEQSRDTWMSKRRVNTFRLVFVPTRDEGVQGLIRLPFLAILVVQDHGFKTTLAVRFPNNFIGCEGIRPDAEQSPPDTLVNERSNQGALPSHEFAPGFEQILFKVLVLLDFRPGERFSCGSIIWKQNPLAWEWLLFLPHILCCKWKEKSCRQVCWFALENKN